MTWHKNTATMREQFLATIIDVCRPAQGQELRETRNPLP